MHASLVIMAAGIGSRYGGNKQTDGVGPHGEILMEYGVYDAVRAGFDQGGFHHQARHAGADGAAVRPHGRRTADGGRPSGGGVLRLSGQHVPTGVVHGAGGQNEAVRYRPRGAVHQRAGA